MLRCGNDSSCLDELLLAVARTRELPLSVWAETLAYAEGDDPNAPGARAVATGYAEATRGLVAVQVRTEIDGEVTGPAEPSLWFRDRFFQRTEDGVVGLTAPGTLLGTAMFPLELLSGAVAVTGRQGEWSDVTISREQLMLSMGPSADEVEEALDMQGMTAVDVWQAQVQRVDGLVREVRIDNALPETDADGLQRLVLTLRIDPTGRRPVDIPATDSQVRIEEFLMDLLAED